MKKIILTVVVFLIGMPACTTYRAFYDIRLVKVTATDETNNACEQGAISYSEKIGCSYDDKLMRAVWIIADYDINVRIKNNAGQPITIVWDKCFYIDEHGVHHAIIHNKTDLRDIGKPQKPTIIYPQKEEPRHIKPADYVLKDGNSWRYLPLFPYSGRTMKAVQKDAERQVGKSFSIMMVIEKDKKEFKYRFIFKINSVSGIKPVRTHF